MSTINKKNSGETQNGKFSFAFGPINYIIMGVGIVVLFIGYVLLTGGGSDDPNVFNNAMFDNRRLVVAPIMITLGLIIPIVAIMIRPNKKNQQNTNAQNEEK